MTTGELFLLAGAGLSGFSAGLTVKVSARVLADGDARLRNLSFHLHHPYGLRPAVPARAESSALSSSVSERMGHGDYRAHVPASPEQIRGTE